jgi:hypothetical protein
MKIIAARFATLVFVLAMIAMIVISLMNLAQAQGVPPLESPAPSTNIITSQGAAWFALVALVAALGIPFTSRAVDFVLMRPWAAFIKGDWQSVVAVSFAIAIAASGGKDSQTRALQKELEMESPK